MSCMRNKDDDKRDHVDKDEGIYANAATLGSLADEEGDYVNIEI